jgi:2-amino-4-hydroxy-6-hydroxymethyldihydropteridine diphosphokinase
LSRDSVAVAIALGSNLGDRETSLRAAVAALAPCVGDLRVSTFHETEPIGVGPQPRFLNAAVVGTTSLSAHRLMADLLDIETRFGRTRPHPGAPRTLDLDLVLFGDFVIDDPPVLIVPHPRFRERRFVLAPLAEIARDWRDPVTGRTIGELLQAVGGRQ